MPAVWGIVAGLGLTAWIYEPKRVRRIGELIAMAGVLVYLVVGVLAAENLRLWLESLPPTLGEFLFDSVMYMHAMNPFGVLRYWFSVDSSPVVAWHRFEELNFAALAICILLALRPARDWSGTFTTATISRSIRRGLRRRSSSASGRCRGGRCGASWNTAAA